MFLGIATTNPVAAQIFGLSVTNTASSIAINSPVTFVLNLTNQSGTELLSVLVTNEFFGPAAPQFVSATRSQGSTFTNASSVLFDLGNMVSGGFAQMTVTVRPTAAGIFTNSVVVASPFGTNITSTNIVVQVAPLTTDLAVSLTPPTTPVLVNDVITYRVAVTNLGTNSVANVILTNADFSSMILLSLSPTNAFTRTNGLLYFNVGTLTSHAGRSFTITAQPTNTGPLSLSATVTATNITESNASNNIVSTNITVEPLVTGDLVAVNFSAMVYNPQTGLMEQTVRLTNNGTNQVASARVIVSGLTNRLYNAVGTNNGNPFVVYGAALNPGFSADLLMEYFYPLKVPFNVPDSNYTAVGTSAVNLSASGIDVTNITKKAITPSGGFLIEFQSIPNRTYTIFYSSELTFSNAFMAQPSITAPADRVQWIDDGPPKTIRHPSSDPTRYYRVLLNP